ncbi:MAG: hypothetical protein OXI54_14445 [Chloroflexota bacterium]|nr:hypothetical protein [Chloroflexota bacterium]
MDWQNLIVASRSLAAGQPSQEALRRAVSTAYYAIFHALATSIADCMHGPRTAANQTDWARTYRSLQHRRAANPLNRWHNLFCQPVQDFANVIGDLKYQREEADYNPMQSFTQSQVNAWIDQAEAAIVDFYQAIQQERTMVAISCLAGNR